MLQRMEESLNTKVEAEAKFEVADILGTSAVAIADLKQKKNSNYEFSWENALTFDGKSGIKLQYTHARLCSLIRTASTASISVDSNLNFGALFHEPEADRLILRLGQYSEALAESYDRLEPSVLVRYLFELCSDVGSAMKVLQVKGCESEEVAIARLCLFIVARKTIAHGMSICGLTPLEKM